MRGVILVFVLAVTAYSWHQPLTRGRAQRKVAVRGTRGTGNPSSTRPPAGNTGAGDPGDLVRVTGSSTVGALLTDEPNPEAAAAFYLTRDDAWWTARAQTQVELTTYRLIFRANWYNANSGKFQLPPPAKEVYQIRFLTAAKRVTMGVHSLVARDYEVLYHIVARAGTARTGDPALGVIGGETSESFFLPADPMLLLQRTGYGCMDEADFPEGSVIGEQEAIYFDDSCNVEAPWDGKACQQCHCTQSASKSCKASLQQNTGRVQLTLRHVRIAWSESIAAAEEAKNPYPLNLAVPGTDLIGWRETMRQNYITYRYVGPTSCLKECVPQNGWRRVLEFPSNHINIGPTDYEVGYLPYTEAVSDSFNPLTYHNLYYWDNCHKHPHFSAYATLGFKVGETTIAGGGKAGFCIEDTMRAVNHRNVSFTSDHWTCTQQGISTGWSDNYNAGIPCQWVDITNVPADTAGNLFQVVNPSHWMCEGVVDKWPNGTEKWVPSGHVTTAPPYPVAGEPIDIKKCFDNEQAWTNNLDELPLTIPAQGHGHITAPCATNQAPNWRRDCGLSVQSLSHLTLACTPGAVVTLTASIPAGSAAQVVRFCESSRALNTGLACRYNDPHHLLTSVVTATGPKTLSFTCPIARDPTLTGETGGLYSLYQGPAWGLDVTVPVSIA